MSHTTTIDADPSDDRQSVRAEPTFPTVLSLTKEARAPLIPHTSDHPALTATEHAVLRWMAVGRSNAQIGQCLCRSEKTVRNQVTRIYTKLGVANRAEAVAVHVRMEFARSS